MKTITELKCTDTKIKLSDSERQFLLIRSWKSDITEKFNIADIELLE